MPQVGAAIWESEPKMLSILARAGIVNPKTWCGEGKEMERFFGEAAGQKLNVFIVLGGDGTIRRAAEACTETSSYLIALPGGTMNMFLKEHRNVAEQQSTIAQLKTTVAQQQKQIAAQQANAAQQQKQIEAVAATVRRVSERVELSAPAPQIAANDD